MTENEICPYLSTGQSATEARILFKHTTQTALPTNKWLHLRCSQPLIFKHTKIQFILKVAVEDVALAQISLIGKPKLI